MAAQMLAALPAASAVVDEPAHLTAGWLALTQAEPRANREHPPLVKLLAALPLLGLGVTTPARSSVKTPVTSEDFEFDYSRLFLYISNDADRLLWWARLPVIFLTLCGAVALCAWARSLIGDWGAVAALALYCFEPNLLAHGRLVTTDMAAAVFTLASFAALERAAGRTGSWLSRAVLPGLCLGAALSSRYSCLLAVPLLGLSLWLDRRPATHARGGLAVATLLIALCVVNLFYGFGGTPIPLGADPVGGPLKSWPLASMEAHPILKWTPLPLPRLYLEGLDLARYKNTHVEGPSYLNGVISRSGFWSYFVQALSMKTPLALLLLACVGCLLVLLRRPLRAEAIWVLLPAAGLLGMTTVLTTAQIGLRYVLPVIPLLCILGGAAAGRAGVIMRPARWVAIPLVAALLAWQAASVLRVHPYHLAYFNEAAGGPQNGYRHLVDSNLDWGQDLGGLARWMRVQQSAPVHLYYFGTADPEYYGLARRSPPEPGWYAVSATHLMGVYLPDPDYLAPFRTMAPAARIGHSIFVYRLENVPPFLRVPIGRSASRNSRRHLPAATPDTRFASHVQAAAGR